MVVNLWLHRSFIWRSAASDFRYRYAGSAAGMLWNVINPLAQITIYTFVFSRIMVVRVSGVSEMGGFALYLCAGLLPWVGFSECVLRGANAFVDNAPYLKKLPIPEQVFVAQSAVSSTLSLAVSMTLLFVVSVFTGGAPWAGWLGVPLVLLLLQGFGFGLGLVFGTLNVFLRDVGQAVVIALQLWMWMTPIVYVEQILPESVRRIIPYHPVYPFVDALHRMIVDGQWPAAGHWPVMVFWACATPLAGYALMRRLRPEIRDAL